MKANSELQALLELVGKDFVVILKNDFVRSADNTLWPALMSAKENLDNASALVGPKGDALAAGIENGKHSALDLAATNVRAMLEQFAVASASGMKSFVQWQRLYESAQTLPAFIADATAARRG